MKDLYVYRHKERKDLYLMRNWSTCGGNADSNWYKVTRDIDKALHSIRMGVVYQREAFECHFRVFGEDTYVIAADMKEFEFDGYKGTLVKETKLYTSEFEKVPVIVGEPDVY